MDPVLKDVLIWLYLCNATLLVVHEIDSAYWREWELFRLPGGGGGFVLAHIPMVAVILYGLTQVQRATFTGMVLSCVLAAGGVFAFLIHLFFILRGRSEFKTPVSLAVLGASLAMSLAQASATIFALATEEFY
ncbi:MAG: hypothetical protein EPN93_19955 [Spirochaetes bacterium]|nr:MAG: hypothetical protein EPN93_19955 [Spirochaetota bacterium]